MSTTLQGRPHAQGELVHTKQTPHFLVVVGFVLVGLLSVLILSFLLFVFVLKEEGRGNLKLGGWVGEEELGGTGGGKGT